MKDNNPFINEDRQAEIIDKIRLLAERAALLDQEYDNLSRRRTECDTTRQQVKEDLATLMETNGLLNVKLDNGLSPRVALQRKFYAKDPDAVQGWLRANGLASIIKETVHFSTMQAALKGFEESGSTIPDEIFTISERPSVTLGNKSAFLANRSISND